MEFSKWYIRAAGDWMRKPSIEKIIKENQNAGVIMVCAIGFKEVFVLGAGDSPYGKIGNRQDFIYDTGMGHRKPSIREPLTIQNVIIIGRDGILDSGNGIGLDQKRSLYVFK